MNIILALVKVARSLDSFTEEIKGTNRHLGRIADGIGATHPSEPGEKIGDEL